MMPNQFFPSSSMISICVFMIWRTPWHSCRALRINHFSRMCLWVHTDSSSESRAQAALRPCNQKESMRAILPGSASLYHMCQRSPHNRCRVRWLIHTPNTESCTTAVYGVYVLWVSRKFSSTSWPIIPWEPARRDTPPRRPRSSSAGQGTGRVSSAPAPAKPNQTKTRRRQTQSDRKW